LHHQKQGLRIEDCARFQETKPDFPYQQILHERNQQMHWGHRQSKLLHSLHFGSHFQILANEFGMANTLGGLGANLTQVDNDGKFYAISFPSR
jgi:hypothetical protein